jgi:cyclophilin family peptidyl-prolyl cis-trans isomerase
VVFALIRQTVAPNEIYIEDHQVYQKPRGHGDQPALGDKGATAAPVVFENPGTPQERHNKIREMNIANALEEDITWETIKTTENYVIPHAGDYVTIHFIGKVRATGYIFEDTYRRNAPFTFDQGSHEAMKCLDMVAAILREGEILRVTCPPKTAYGRRGVAGAIPGGAWLVFEVEMMKIFCRTNCIGTNPPTTEAPDVVDARRAKFDEILQPPVPYKVDYGANLHDVLSDPFLVEFWIENLVPDATGATTGKFIVEFQPKWAPIGVRRIHDLLVDDFYDELKIHRRQVVGVTGLVEFGINGNPHVMEYWNNHPIPDDPFYWSPDGYKPGISAQEDISDDTVTNQPRFVTMGHHGMNTRATTLIINTGTSKITTSVIMDQEGFRPVGVITQGFELIERIYNCGDNYPHGPGPDVNKILSQGTNYLEEQFPKLSVIKKARRKMSDFEVAEEEEDDPDNFVHVHCHVTSKALSAYDHERAHLIEIEVHPDWAPNGAKRFLDLVRDRYFDGSALFRAIPNFLVQFGIAKEESKRQKWLDKTIEDDPMRPDIPIDIGTVSFAGTGTDSRSTQIWIALADNTTLGDRPWEVPFGRVVGDRSLRVLHSLNTKYGDNVDQSRIWHEGDKYLETEFPELDRIIDCWVDELGRQVPVTLEDERSSKPAESSERSVGPLSLVVLVSLALIVLCRQSGKKANAKMWGVEPVKEV